MKVDTEGARAEPGDRAPLQRHLAAHHRLHLPRRAADPAPERLPGPGPVPAHHGDGQARSAQRIMAWEDALEQRRARTPRRWPRWACTCSSRSVLREPRAAGRGREGRHAPAAGGAQAHAHAPGHHPELRPQVRGGGDDPERGPRPSPQHRVRLQDAVRAGQDVRLRGAGPSRRAPRCRRWSRPTAQTSIAPKAQDPWARWTSSSRLRRSVAAGSGGFEKGNARAAAHVASAMALALPPQQPSPSRSRRRAARVAARVSCSRPLPRSPRPPRRTR